MRVTEIALSDFYVLLWLSLHVKLEKGGFYDGRIPYYNLTFCI